MRIYGVIDPEGGITLLSLLDRVVFDVSMVSTETWKDAFPSCSLWLNDARGQITTSLRYLYQVNENRTTTPIRHR